MPRNAIDLGDTYDPASMRYVIEGTPSTPQQTATLGRALPAGWVATLRVQAAVAAAGFVMTVLLDPPVAPVVRRRAQVTTFLLDIAENASGTEPAAAIDITNAMIAFLNAAGYISRHRAKIEDGITQAELTALANFAIDNSAIVNKAAAKTAAASRIATWYTGA